MRRIVIVGNGAAGKTTLAQHLSTRFDIPLFDLDDLAWCNHRTQTGLEQIREQLKDIVSQPCWIIDGALDGIQDLIFTRAEAIVHMNLHPLQCARQLVLRSASRGFERRHEGEGVVQPGSRLDTLRSVLFYRRHDLQNVRRKVALYGGSAHYFEICSHTPASNLARQLSNLDSATPHLDGQIQMW